jgi:hypothetical protein
MSEDEQGDQGDQDDHRFYNDHLDVKGTMICLTRHLLRVAER